MSRLTPLRSRSARWILVLVGLGTPTWALAQAPAAPSATFRALRTAQPPVIDGRLSDEAWSQVEAASDFTQRDPDEGKPATERTEVRSSTTTMRSTSQRGCMTASRT